MTGRQLFVCLLCLLVIHAAVDSLITITVYKGEATRSACTLHSNISVFIILLIRRYYYDYCRKTESTTPFRLTLMLRFATIISISRHAICVYVDIYFQNQICIQCISNARHTAYASLYVLCLVMRTCVRGRLNKKDGLTRHGNSHVKDKTC